MPAWTVPCLTVCGTIVEMPVCNKLTQLETDCWATVSPVNNVYFSPCFILYCSLFYAVLFLYCTVPCEALGVSRVQARGRSPIIIIVDIIIMIFIMIITIITTTTTTTTIIITVIIIVQFNLTTLYSSHMGQFHQTVSYQQKCKTPMIRIDELQLTGKQFIALLIYL